MVQDLAGVTGLQSALQMHQQWASSNPEKSARLQANEHNIMRANKREFAGHTNSFMAMKPEQMLQLTLKGLTCQGLNDNTDPSALVSQVAQLVMLTQSTKANENAEKTHDLQKQHTLLGLSQAAGKNAEVKGDSFRFDGATNVDIGFDLSSAAKCSVIQIYNDHSELVQEIKLLKAQLQKGRNTVVWDGKNKDGIQLAAGEYSVKVCAYDDHDKPLRDFDGKLLTVPTYVSGVVNGGVINDENEVQVLVNGVAIPSGSLTSLT